MCAVCGVGDGFFCGVCLGGRTIFDQFCMLFSFLVVFKLFSGILGYGFGFGSVRGCGFVFLFCVLFWFWLVFLGCYWFVFMVFVVD